METSDWIAVMVVAAVAVVYLVLPKAIAVRAVGEVAPIATLSLPTMLSPRHIGTAAIGGPLY